MGCIVRGLGRVLVKRGVVGWEVRVAKQCVAFFAKLNDARDLFMDRVCFFLLLSLLWVVGLDLLTLFAFFPVGIRVFFFFLEPRAHHVGVSFVLLSSAVLDLVAFFVFGWRLVVRTLLEGRLLLLFFFAGFFHPVLFLI